MTGEATKEINEFRQIVKALVEAQSMPLNQAQVVDLVLRAIRRERGACAKVAAEFGECGCPVIFCREHGISAAEFERKYGTGGLAAAIRARKDVGE